MVVNDSGFKLAAPPPPLRIPFSSPYRGGRTSIGVLAPCYGASHVIYGLDTPHFRHEKLRALTLSKLERSGTFFSYTPLVLDVGVPLLHTWNAIPINKDFVLSFELEIPRYLGGVDDRLVAFALRMLQSERCKAVLPLSEFARRWALERFAQFGCADLARKTQIFRGAVRDPLHQNRVPRVKFHASNGPFRAILIGTQLFHKGVVFAVQAFKKLREEGHNVELTIIGEFEHWSHGFRQQTPSGSYWRELISREGWVSLLGPVSRDEVFNQLRQHHVCLAPSLDESLGWLTIEAQLCEVPVIANRICAHPELVQHGKSGWLIDLPLSPDGRWIGMYAEGEEHATALARADELITRGIIDAVEILLRKPSVLEKWAAVGRENMLHMYGVERASKELELIYESALFR